MMCIPGTCLQLHFISTLAPTGCGRSSHIEPNGVSHQFTGTFTRPYFKLKSNNTAAEEGNSWKIVASSCALYPCIKELRANVRNGRLNEVTVSEVPIYPHDDRSSPIAMLKCLCFINDIRYDEHNMLPEPPETFATNALIPYQCVSSIPFEIFRSIAKEEWYLCSYI